MTDGRNEPGDALREYRRLSAELDDLWARGLGESDEAERLRDRMDGPWRRMTDAERDGLRRGR